MQRTYPAGIKSLSAEQIADQLIGEAKTQGLGALGEIGQESGVLTADETKVFQAVGKVQAKTGLPIFTHNAYSGTRQSAVPKEAGLRQLDVLEAAGAQAQQVAIGHMCCLDDPKAEIGIQLAKRGAFVGFDRVGIQQIIPDSSRAAMIMAMVEAGFADHVLISSDFYNGAATKSKGGNGIAQSWTVFAPMLRNLGLTEAKLHQIMFDNPRRFLAFVPKK
jgi:phosphotriesterase-related protein